MLGKIKNKNFKFHQYNDKKEIPRGQKLNKNPGLEHQANLASGSHSLKGQETKPQATRDMKLRPQKAIPSI